MAEEKSFSPLDEESILWRRFRFSEVIFVPSQCLHFRVTHFFSLFLFQKGCLIAKRMKDGGLGLFDEKLISWRLKYDHSGIIHLFTENVLDQFFSNI